jgi:hypothetical protein
LALITTPAIAAPEGAPWTHDGGPGRPDCSACHFDAEPARQSDSLVLHGLPASLRSGASYELSLEIKDEALLTAGFLITAEMKGRPAGLFAPADERTAANGAALRSTKRGVVQAEQGAARWIFRWTAPRSIVGPVTFRVAANASNDDASALGDKIFISAFEARP